MCTNAHYVTNVYTGKRLLVRCGKCEACQQEKASARSNRIRNNMKDGYIALFSTHTYSNDTVPYIYRKDYCGTGTYTIYRDNDVRFSKHGYIVKKCNKPLARLFLEPDEFAGLFGVPDLTNYSGRIGILYYKDMKDFYKRLRINLKRNYDINYKIEYFTTGEYGETFYRPHFHSLIFCKREDESAFRSAIAESWLYDRLLPQRMCTEIARDCAAYCSSYVNCGSDFPSFLKTHGIAPLHTYSKNFGVGLQCFSLNEILEKVKLGDFHYYRAQNHFGIPAVIGLPIPKYVINRYFPLFKGYCRLAPLEVFELLRFPFANRFLLYHRTENDFIYQGKRFKIDNFSPAHWKLFYDDRDFHEFLTRLNNAVREYYRLTGKSRFDYAIDYLEVWNCYFSMIFKESFLEKDGKQKTDFSNHYENVCEVNTGLVHTDLDCTGFQVNPNMRKDIMDSTAKLQDVYSKMKKQRKINNLAFAKYNV